MLRNAEQALALFKSWVAGSGTYLRMHAMMTFGKYMRVLRIATTRLHDLQRRPVRVTRGQG